ncbi:MAG TPA: hypothetical protein VJO99_18940 [Burkholderiaceae bacterium]|nr:hypothetical protein [Burkholderiaceae bacterium]
MPLKRLFAGACLAGLAALCAATAATAAADSDPDVDLPALKFGELFKRPIGPRGLEPGPRVLALAGLRVRIVGYAVRNAEPLPQLAILAPLPVTLGDEDESYADDLPAGVVYLHDPEGGERGLARTVERCAGPASVVGRLEVGARPEADGRVSFVRLNAESARCLAAAR